MLRALDGDTLLARPLSAVSEERGVVGFLCEPRGAGIAAIARAGAELSVLGPLGRGFELGAAGSRPLLVGGGFGAALLARPAAALPGRGAARGLPQRGARRGRVARAGRRAPRRGRARAHHRTCSPSSSRDATSVLAAGPGGLVRAAAAAALAADLPCQVALEAPMACGYGSCHGCAVAPRRTARAPLPRGPGRGRAAPGADDVSVVIGAVELEHPVLNASGTLDALARCGRRRAGAPRRRRARHEDDHAARRARATRRRASPRAPSGLLNSIGLANPGVDEFVRRLPALVALGRPLVVSIGGFSVDDYVAARPRARRAPRASSRSS